MVVNSHFVKYAEKKRRLRDARAHAPVPVLAPMHLRPRTRIRAPVPAPRVGEAAAFPKKRRSGYELP